MRVLSGMLLSVYVLTASSAPAQDIVDVAAGEANFSTLVAALEAADLVETLKGPGPFTVFAPTNEAFAKLPPGTLDDLLKPENKAKLTSILTYHVVPGAVKAADAIKLSGQSATTVEGSPLAIVYNGETVRVGGATVTRTDIEATNGVIHVIDTVLLPPALGQTPAPTAVTPATVYDVAPRHHAAPAVIYTMPAPVYTYHAAPAPVHAYPYPAYRVMPSYRYHPGSSCGR